MQLVEDGIEPHPGPGGGGQIGDSAPGVGNGEGSGAGTGRRATVRTASVRHLVGCTFGHKSGKTVPVSGGGSNRRAYICGKCRQNFVQNDPASEGYEYSERRPVEKTEGRRPKKQDIECPPERGASTTDARTRCLGDFTIRFHNSGGLACPEMRRRYLRKMMRGVDILGICETSWESTREADARTVAAWDPKIKADLYVAGQYQRASGSARNAGLALLVRRGAEVKDVRVRHHGDQTLQCMIADLTIRGEKVRVVLTHGDPGSVLSAKEAVYRRVERAIRRVQAEDKREGAVREGAATQRRAIWMADHNMVKDRALDEDRGTSGSLAAHQRLVAALESAESCLSGEGSMADGYEATHEPGSRGYTHGVRRIDRAAVSPTLLDKGGVPRVEGVEHVAQDRLEVAMRTARGWELRTPHHKAVDVTLRFSDEPRAKSSTWVAKGREAYPPQVWRKAMGEMRKEVARRVRVKLEVRAGGGVAVGLARTTPAERQSGWEVAVRGVLEGYERADRKQVCKQIGSLRKDRERLRRAIEGAREGSARHKGFSACLQRRDRQIQALKIRMGMTEEERARRGLWSLGKDQRVTHEVLGGGGSVGPHDVIEITHPDKGKVTTQEDILEAFEQHMVSTFNLHGQGGHEGGEVQGGAAGEGEPAGGAGEGDEGGGEGATGRGASSGGAGAGEEDRAACRRRIIECIRAHRAAVGEREVQRVMKGLEVKGVKGMLGKETVDKAIDQVKKGTVSGSDGFDTGFYAFPCVREALGDHLGVMFAEIREDKRMPESMRRVRLSMLHKGKGRSTLEAKNYRPIAVTNTAYRVMMKAVQLKLAPVVTKVVGKTQVAYLTDGRRIWDNTLLLAEVARRLEAEGEGGAAVQVDNTAAFDRVEWGFLQEVMEAMGFPGDFRAFVSEVYTDLQFAIKVNGRTGGDKDVSNGVRQGCPASPLIFLIVQEALLAAIRGDAVLRGVTVGVGGGRNVEVRERCMADDTVVYLQSAAQASRLFEIIRTFEIASGQKLNPSKSTGILFGKEKQADTPTGTGIKWLRFGEAMVEEGLGIRVGTEAQVEEQWREEARGMVEEMRGQMTQCKSTMGTTARVRCIQSAFVSKLVYPWQVQAPRCADEIVSGVQKQMDAALFEGREGGKGWYFVDRNLAVQPLEDGGLGQVDLQCRLEAMWGGLVLSLRGREEVWKGAWERELEEVYGGLRGRDLVGSTCGFQLFAQHQGGLEVMRRGVAALAKLPPPEGRVIVPVERATAGGERDDGAQGEGGVGSTDRDEPAWRLGGMGDVEWRLEDVEEQWLFFNPCYRGGTRLTGRSTYEVEVEAVKWSKVGLRTWGDLSWGGRLITEEELHRAYSHLDRTMHGHLMTELHEEWKRVLGGGEGLWAEGSRDEEGGAREVLAVCCWYDVYDDVSEGGYLGQYVWELFSTVGRRGQASRALWHMRRACGWRGAGVELQVHGRNPEARACYERLGGRRTAWWAGGVEAGDGGRWREPGRGQEMMRFEAAALDETLRGKGGGQEVEGEEVIVADSLEELKEEGVFDGVCRAAGVATGHQQWRPRGELPCLRTGGDGQGCRYVVIARKRGGRRGTGERTGSRKEDGPEGRAGERDGEEVDEAHSGAPKPKVQIAITRADTLTAGTAMSLDGMGVKEVYGALVAGKWSMPKAFREGGYGRRVWAAKGRDAESMREDVAKVYAGLRHSAVPLHWSDRAYKAATGTEFAGSKLLGRGARCGACTCGDADTQHRYSGCPEVGRLWAQVFEAWRRISGGERLAAGDEWVTAWGARWSTWSDEQEQERFGNDDLEEVFQVVHKATIQAIHEAAGRRVNRTARTMYQRVQYLVGRAVVDRAGTVPRSTFARVWERPGYATRVGREKVICTARMWGKDFEQGAHARKGRGSGSEAKEEAAAARKARAESMIAGGATEVYTDGSGQGGAAGWGWVAVSAGREVRARRGPVVVGEGGAGWRGAERATNNTGELTAVLEAIEWAIGRGLREVVIRYDSEYAAHMTRGDWQARVNKLLIEQSRRALERAGKAGCEVGWKHVKGHSGDRWNDRADVLADAGVRAPPGGEEVTPEGEVEGRGREVDARGLRPDFKAGGGEAAARVEPRGCSGCGVRWVTYWQSATRRVERATTGFGVLNMPVPAQPVAAPKIRAQANRLAAKVRQEVGAGRVERVRAEGAVRRLHAAATLLRSAEAQREEMYRHRRPRAVTAVDCDINVEGLEEYVGKLTEGQVRQAAVRQVQAVLAKAKRHGPGRARLRVEYRYSQVGRALVEAGHVTGSRVYAIGVDPFKGWDKGLRGAAMHDMGWECDDEAAYVAARVAMVPGGREVTERFVEHREEILAGVGDALFRAHGDYAARRQWAKRIFAGYDNDATLEGWAHSSQGRHEGRTVGRVKLWVGETATSPGVAFEPREYWRAQKESTRWMWEHAGAELREYVQAMRPRATAAAHMGTWKSYALQEAEAAGRNEKIAWAAREGMQVLSLQHDGVIIGQVGPDGADVEEGEAIEEGLTEAVSRAVGYRVRVRVAWCAEARAAVQVD